MCRSAFPFRFSQQQRDEKPTTKGFARIPETLEVGAIGLSMAGAMERWAERAPEQKEAAVRYIGATAVGREAKPCRELHTYVVFSCSCRVRAVFFLRRGFSSPAGQVPYYGIKQQNSLFFFRCSVGVSVGVPSCVCVCVCVL